LPTAPIEWLPSSKLPPKLHSSTTRKRKRGPWKRACVLERGHGKDCSLAKEFRERTARTILQGPFLTKNKQGLPRFMPCPNLYYMQKW
jgi:hypothetical protein